MYFTRVGSGLPRKYTKTVTNALAYFEEVKKVF